MKKIKITDQAPPRNVELLFISISDQYSNVLGYLNKDGKSVCGSTFCKFYEAIPLEYFEHWIDLGEL